MQETAHVMIPNKVRPAVPRNAGLMEVLAFAHLLDCQLSSRWRPVLQDTLAFIRENVQRLQPGE